MIAKINRKAITSKNAEIVNFARIAKIVETAKSDQFAKSARNAKIASNVEIAEFSTKTSWQKSLGRDAKKTNIAEEFQNCHGCQVCQDCWKCAD